MHASMGCCCYHPHGRVMARPMIGSRCNDPYFHATNFIGQAHPPDKRPALAACLFLCFLCVVRVQHCNLHVDGLGWGPKSWTQTPESHEHGRAGQQVLVSCIVAQLHLQLQGGPGHPQKPFGCLVIGILVVKRPLGSPCNHAVPHDFVGTVVPVVRRAQHRKKLGLTYHTWLGSNEADTCRLNPHTSGGPLWFHTHLVTHVCPYRAPS